MSSWCPGRLLRAFALTVGVAGLAAGAIAVGSVPGLAAAESRLPEPVLGQRETLRVSAGTVTVRAKGGVAFSRISGPVSVPDGSEIDASHGRVEVTAATLQPGETATAEAYQGRFLLHQDLLAPAETHLILSQPLLVAARRGLPVRPQRRERWLRASNMVARRSPAICGSETTAATGARTAAT